MIFDLGHVLVLAWEEPREQALSINEGDYLGGLGRTVRLRDRLQGGEKWVIVWRLCGCSLAGMLGESRCGCRGGVLANALCVIWCGRVFFYQRDWLLTSGGLPVVSG